ncbi:MAG TPA: acetolactate synthase small subunit [Firmicutes bacterium]|jgi:acetolactate synthase-1/3 small subunit|nr:acetolactate synthase small subunit [Bacillota bacterium]HOQ24376.1 acetolactate synthase small subunit [Bacillota bacterium]
MKHTLAIMVVNNPGVLSRVAGLYSRRGFNIDSIAVGPTEDPKLSRMIVVVQAEDDAQIEQITKQLYKLIDVVKISDITMDDSVERELALIKVAANSGNRSEILQIVDIFRAKIVDVAEQAVIIEVTGDQEKLEAIISLLHPFGIREIVRTGKIAMVRSGKR